MTLKYSIDYGFQFNLYSWNMYAKPIIWEKIQALFWVINILTVLLILHIYKLFRFKKINRVKVILMTVIILLILFIFVTALTGER